MVKTSATRNPHPQQTCAPALAVMCCKQSALHIHWQTRNPLNPRLLALAAPSQDPAAAVAPFLQQRSPRSPLKAALQMGAKQQVRATTFLHQCR